MRIKKYCAMNKNYLLKNVISSKCFRQKCDKDFPW
jgi:hypothetical protein